MKKIHLTAVIVVSLLCISLSGCDFIRKVAGKPTSEDLAELLAIREAKARAEADSIAAAKAAAEEAARIEQEKAAGTLKFRYYVVAGGFKVPGNADKLKKKLEENGFEALLVKFKNGYETVLTGGAETSQQANQNRREMGRAGLAPDDLWVYDAEKKLHIEE